MIRVNRVVLTGLIVKPGNFPRYLHNPNDSLTLINDRIGAIFEDSRGTFWVSTARDGLHTINRKGTFQRHTYDPSHPNKLRGPPPQNDVGLDLNNFFVTEDSLGAIWIASSKRWVTRYDPKTKKVHHFDSFNGDVHAVRWGPKSSLHAKEFCGLQPGEVVFPG